MGPAASSLQCPDIGSDVCALCSAGVQHFQDFQDSGIHCVWVKGCLVVLATKMEQLHVAINTCNLSVWRLRQKVHDVL